MIEFPEVEVIDGKHVFVIPKGWRVPLRRGCDCSICEPIGIAGWRLYEDDVECIDKGRRRWPRRRGGDPRSASGAA